MGHLTHISLLVICLAPLALSTTTVEWDSTIYDQSFKVGSSVVLRCLATEVDVVNIVKIVKVVVINGFSEEWTVVTKGVLSAPYYSLSRYSVHYEYIQDLREGILDLFINGLQLEDGARYKCLAGSPFKNTKSIDVVIPVPLDDLHLTQIQGMDSVGSQVAEGATVHIRPGRSAGVSCVLRVTGSDIVPVVEVSVSGNTTFNMSDLHIWENKTVTPLTDAGNGYYSQSVTYHYAYLRDDPDYTLHRQTLTCQGHTPEYQGQQQTQSVVLDVQFKPVFSCTHREAYGRRGRPTEFVCTVFSRPAPAVSATWGYTAVLKGSMRASEMSGAFSVSVQTYESSDMENTVTFSISSLENSHFSYVYTLVASNSHGSSNMQFSVKEGAAPWKITGSSNPLGSSSALVHVLIAACLCILANS